MLKRLKPAQRMLLAVVLAAVLIVIFLDSQPRKVSSTGQADLALATTTTDVPAGSSGSVEVLIGNDGPAAVDDDVTFTVTTPARLIISGAGRIGANPFPDDGCVPQRSGHLMTCRARLTVQPYHWLQWHIPVQVAAGTAAHTGLRLNVSAAADSASAEGRANNNTDVGFTVVPGGLSAEAPRSSGPSRPATPGSTPAHSRQPSGAASPSKTAKPGDDALGEVMSPVMLAVWILVGLGFLAIGALAVVALVQRRMPMNYIPPRRYSSWQGPFSGKWRSPR